MAIYTQGWLPLVMQIAEKADIRRLRLTHRKLPLVQDSRAGLVSEADAE